MDNIRTNFCFWMFGEYIGSQPKCLPCGNEIVEHDDVNPGSHLFALKK